MQTEQQNRPPKIIIATPCAFELGTVATTRAIYSVMLDSPRFSAFVADCIGRHARKDWGDLDDDDKRANELDLATGGHIFSAYNIPASCPETRDGKIWIETGADRAHTVVMFPSER